MKNFVEINYLDLKDKEFIQLEIRRWKWGNYILMMETDLLENDIIEFLKDKEVKINFLKGE